MALKKKFLPVYLQEEELLKIATALLGLLAPILKP
jgi:hypothetical protein